MYVVTYPKMTIILCFLLTVLFATQLPKMTIDANIRGNFPPDFPAKRALDNLESIFGGSEIVLLGIVSDNIYAPNILQKIRRLTKEIENLKETAAVTSLFTIHDLIETEKGIKVSHLIESIPDAEKKTQVLRERLRSHPVFWNNFISKDETVTAIIATMVPGAKDDVVYEKFQAIQAREIKAAQREEGGGIRLSGSLRPGSSAVEFYLGGMPITRALLAVNIQQESKKCLPGGLCLMMILLYLSFRSLRGILLPLSVVLMSSICTLGLMVFLEKPILITGLMIPVMLIAIVNSYGIQIVADYYANVKAELAGKFPHIPFMKGEGGLANMKGEALSAIQVIVLNVLNRHSLPILLTGMITAAGLSSLLIHIIPSIKYLGIFASFGIIMAVIFNLTYVPAWLTILPISNVLLQTERKTWLMAILPRAIISIRKHPRLPKILVIIGIFLTLVFLPGIPQIVLHDSSMKYYEEQHPLVVSTRLFNEKLGGIMTIDVVFAGDLKSPAVLKKIQTVQEYMDRLPTIGKTLSILDILKEMNQAMHKGDPTYYTIPETRDLIGYYLSLYGMSGGMSDLDHLVNREYCKGRLIGRMHVTSTTDIIKTVKAVEAYVAKLFSNGDPPKIESITGFPVLLKELVLLVDQGQKRSLLLALVIIFVVAALAFRSFSAGLLTVYPIAVALVIVFGFIGYRGIDLSVTIMVFFTILLGIGVDFTIHFLCHYREEIRQYGRTPDEALEMTFQTAGQGILSNALAVAVGFAVCMFSAFLPVASFGGLLTFSILTCVMSVFILLPAAILVFKPKFIFT